jgi:hypothetical protein
MGRSLTLRRVRLAATSAVVLLAVCSCAGTRSGPPRSYAAPTSGTATPASAAVPQGGWLIFVGDFEFGDFSQWTQCQNHVYSGPCKDMAADFYGMQVVRGGARQGKYAARFELRDGDHPQWGGGERTEVARYGSGRVHEGDERWYEFSLMFDPAFPVQTDKSVMVMQWHGADDLPPPLGLDVEGDGQLVLTSLNPQGPPMVIGDIARGQWVDYVVHAMFSRSSETGWVEVYRNGDLTVPRHARANMNSDVDYLKMGLYRSAQESSTAVMWANGMRITAPGWSTAHATD